MLIEREVLEREDVAAMTLGDWGAMIGSPWFKHLAHKGAMSGLTTYGNVDSFSHYAPNALLRHLLILDEDEPLNSTVDYLEVQPWQAAEDEYEYTAVTATPKLIRLWAEGIKRQNSNGKYTSAGCPVARHTNRLPVEMTKDDSHIRALIEDGTLTVSGPTTERPDIVVVSQIDSAIDLQLTSLGQKLITYHKRHGSPVYESLSCWNLPRLDYRRRRYSPKVFSKHLVRASLSESELASGSLVMVDR